MVMITMMMMNEWMNNIDNDIDDGDDDDDDDDEGERLTDPEVEQILKYTGTEEDLDGNIKYEGNWLSYTRWRDTWRELSLTLYNCSVSSSDLAEHGEYDWTIHVVAKFEEIKVQKSSKKFKIHIHYRQTLSIFSIL